MNVIELREYEGAFGQFEDYKELGEYAKARMPRIAEDIFTGPETHQWDQGVIREVGNRKGPERWWRPTEEHNLNVINEWRQTQEKAIELFYDTFCRAVVEGNFIQNQRTTLLNLVSDLREYQYAFPEQYRDYVPQGLNRKFVR